MPRCRTSAPCSWSVFLWPATNRVFSFWTSSISSGAEARQRHRDAVVVFAGPLDVVGRPVRRRFGTRRLVQHVEQPVEADGRAVKGRKVVGSHDHILLRATWKRERRIPSGTRCPSRFGLGLEKNNIGRIAVKNGLRGRPQIFLRSGWRAAAAAIVGLSRRHSQDNLKGGSSPPTSARDPTHLKRPSPGSLPKARGQARACVRPPHRAGAPELTQCHRGASALGR